MDSRLKIHIKRQKTLEHIQSTAGLLSFVSENNIKSLTQMTEKISSMKKAFVTLQNDVTHCDDISKRLESLKAAAQICNKNYSVAETYSNKKLFKAAYYNHYKQEIDSFIEAQGLLCRTGRYNENTKPNEIENLIEVTSSKRETLVDTLRNQKNEVIIYKIRKTEMEELLGINKKTTHKRAVKKFGL